MGVSWVIVQPHIQEFVPTDMLNGVKKRQFLALSEMVVTYFQHFYVNRSFFIEEWNSFSGGSVTPSPKKKDASGRHWIQLKCFTSP